MKKIKLISVTLAALALMLAFSLTSLASENEYVEGVFTYTINNNSATIVKCNESASGHVIMPENIGEYTVTAIEKEAFKNCAAITDISIPKTIETIKKDAFLNCDNIESVYIDSLENWFLIDFEHSTSNPLRYAEEFYVNGVLTTDIVIPENITTVKKYAFSGFNELQTLTITENTTELESYAFGGCNNMVVHVEKIEDWLNIYFNHKTANPLYFGKGLLYIAGEPISENLVIPENTNIRSHAFTNCKYIRTVTIPSSCTLGYSVFEDSSATSFILGSLTDSSLQPTMRIPYNTFNGAKVINLTVGYGVKEIANDLFKNMQILQNVTLYNGIESIGKNAFNGTCITSVTIPSSVKSVGENAFANCRNLTNVTLGDRLEKTAITEIGNRGFYNCPKLEKVTFNTGVKSFGENVFEKCSNIKDVYINDLTSYLNIAYLELLAQNSAPAKLADNIYVNGKAVKNLVIPEGVTKISDFAFYNCTALESVTFPSTLKYIGDSAFSNCANIKELNFPDSLETIGEFSFFGCTGLTKVELGKNVKEVELGAFEYCKNLELVVIHKNISKAEEWAFGYCENLKQILYTGTDEEWMNFVTRNPKANLNSVPVVCNFNPEAFFAPKNITTSQTSDSINLSWTTVEGASGYRVYVMNKQTGNWSIVVRSTGRKPAATINGLQSGTQYTFAVKTYMNTGTLVVWSPGYTVVNTVTRPDVPLKVNAACNSNTAKLSWPSVSGATGYRIFRQTASGWKAIKTTGLTTYSLSGHEQGKTYTYAVRTYTKYNGEYIWASSYKKVTFTPYSLATPVVTLNSSLKGTVTLSWNDISGENGYQIWYSQSKTNGYKKIDNYRANTVSATVKSMEGFESGHTYYFRVRAYKHLNGTYIYSPFSSVKSVVVK